MAPATLIAFLLIIVLFFILNQYRDDDGRLPPASSPEGKKVRIIAVPILAVCSVIFIMSYAGGVIPLSLPTLAALVIAIGIPVFRYIQFRNKDK